MESQTTRAVRTADLDTWSQRDWRDGLQIETLHRLDELHVRTRNTTYEIVVLCPQTGEVLVRGGRYFPVYAPARLAGCSLGGSFLKLRGIYVGFSLELHEADRSIVTTRIQSIARTAARRDVH